MTHTSREAVTHLDATLCAWGASAEDASRRASAAARRFVAEAESEVQRRGRRVATIEADLATAKGELRGRLTRDLGVATSALEHGRRALRQAKDVERRVQVLQRRISEATNTRVSHASQALRHKLKALAEYESVPTPSSSGTVSGPTVSRGHAYAQLAKMVGLAMTTQTADAVAQTGEPATARMPDRIGHPLSIAGAAFHEAHGNWDVYRHTPEFLSMYAHDVLRKK